MGVVECEEVFAVPPAVLFEVFLNDNILTTIGRGARATVDAKEGGSFSLFDGNIVGTFTTIEKPHRIVQQWRFQDWSGDVYSTVELRFADSRGSCTKLTLKQTDIPSTDKYGNIGIVERCKDGWDVNFWDRIDKMLGYTRRKDS
eukprot:GHVS01030453.1.p1 GENE.GHVS01030453.1~~GHVS01030453.1.p1  ORF type:complete len:144 (+),score=28.16 GHVS01030453.1:480-911(+)